MMPGITEAIIVGHAVGATASGQVTVTLTLEVGEETVPAKIFIGPKSAGMARAKLRKCGFDPDKMDVSALQKLPPILQGNKVRVAIDEHERYGWQADIVLASQATDEQLKEATELLRRVKKADEAVAASGDEIPF